MDTLAPKTLRERPKFGPQGTLPPEEASGAAKRDTLLGAGPAVATAPLEAPLSPLVVRREPPSLPPLPVTPSKPCFSFVVYSPDETLVGVRQDDLRQSHARLDEARAKKIGFAVLGVTLPAMLLVLGIVSQGDESPRTLRATTTVASAIVASAKMAPTAKPTFDPPPFVPPLSPRPRSRSHATSR